VSENF